MWITLDNGYDILQEIKSENPTTLRKPTKEEGKYLPGFSKNVGIWNYDNIATQTLKILSRQMLLGF